MKYIFIWYLQYIIFVDIFSKSLVKLQLVWLFKKNISLKPWDGGSIIYRRSSFVLLNLLTLMHTWFIFLLLVYVTLCCWLLLIVINYRRPFFVLMNLLTLCFQLLQLWWPLLKFWKIMALLLRRVSLVSCNLHWSHSLFSFLTWSKFLAEIMTSTVDVKDDARNRPIQKAKVSVLQMTKTGP